MMINRLRRLILVSRPISWPNTAYPFAVGYLVSGGGINAPLIIGTLFFLIPYNFVLYGINDVFDYESDIRNPRKGGIEGMREERALHPLIMRASILTALPFAVYLLTIGSWQSKVVLIGVLFFVVAYSIKGLRFKEKPVLDSITSSLHFVGPLLYALSLTMLTPAALPAVIAFFLWGCASHAFGAVQDILPDRAGGLSSIATFFGARATVRLCLGLYVAASVVISFVSLPIGLVGLLYVANAAPYANVTTATSASTNRAWRRFIWLNLVTGFVVTIVIIVNRLR
jgi:4-hydroxybenzoate polyprenyltransferase